MAHEDGARSAHIGGAKRKGLWWEHRVWMIRLQVECFNGENSCIGNVQRGVIMGNCWLLAL